MDVGFFDELLPRLEGRARRLTDSPEAAQDLAQEAALRLWQQMAAGRGIDAPDRYAMILLHNLARARWRRRRPSEEIREDLLTTKPVAPQRIACAELAAAITRLPPNQRRLMRLVQEGEVSPAALATRLNLPPGTVMSRLARARAQLRREMGLARGASVDELF
ncbi:MAG: sigma-70 family RNA polymerase sigma factor [Sulfitobacter sp.]|nr:sigma-70 family RNA polymerase sigma factor [Sulfitobacter sp.]